MFEDSEVLESDSLDDVEEVEDIELEETGEDTLGDEESQDEEGAWEETIDQEDAQDEEEEQSFQPSMGLVISLRPRHASCILQNKRKEAVPVNYTLMHKDIPVVK